MNTFLSAAQQAAKEQYRAYVRQHIEPISLALQQRQASMKDVLQKLGQSGYLGLTVPKEYGGLGGAFLNLVLLAEALGEFEAGVALALAEHTAVIELIKKYGTDMQKSRYLPLLAQGGCIAAMAVHEATAGSDVKSAISTATRESQQYIVHGTKTWVVNGELATLFIVSAKEGDSADLSLFLIDVTGEAQSIRVGSDYQKLGMRSVPTNDVEFNGHKIAAEALLKAGADGSDEQILFAGDVAKTIVAASALGILDSAINTSVAHANTREQFGQKIGQFQAIQWKLADMSTEMAACRMLTYRAAWAKDEVPESFRKEASMCKWYAAKVARNQSAEALQILGAEGLLTDSPTERLYRDSKVMEICEGTAEFQKMTLARELDI